MTLFEHDRPDYYAPGPPPGTLANPNDLIDYFDGCPDQNPWFFLSNFAPTPFEASVGGFPWTSSRQARPRSKRRRPRMRPTSGASLR